MDSNRTIARLWREAVSGEREGTAYLVQHGDHWHEVSWGQAAARVENLANGLLARGIVKGDAFATLARTTLEWALFDFALAQVGAVGAGIYANSSSKDVGYVLAHSEAVGVLCEDATQVEKVDAERASLPRLRHILTFADLAALEAEGVAFKAQHPSALDEAIAAIDEDDLFTFIYTSGTTGPPKACMIRHRNYYAMVSVVDRLPGYFHGNDLMLLYLPLAHNFGRLMHLAGPYVGYTTAFLPDPLKTADALTTLGPTVLPSVPRVYEKIHTAIVSAIDEATGAKRRLAEWSLVVGREASAREAAGNPVTGALALKLRVADKLVFTKIRARLGGRLRTPISGGAPLSKEIEEFFDAIGIRILEAYGLTECTTGVTTNTPQNWRFGTVGQAFPGTELRLAEDGELLVKSETVFAGYYKEPEATADVLDADGWVHTGDIAEIDADGFVTITDRKKDILVTAGGKNIAPQNIENDLKASKYVSQAVVVGDRRPYPAALITLDAIEIGKWADAQGIADGPDELASDDRVRELIQVVVDDTNRDRSRYEQIKRFAILPRDFTMEHDEMTPTLKLKRKPILEHFADVVESLYDA
ncbi:long-chain fatty acid--CoA ligase [Gaiella sp.]|uniref:AMP-dependent synthetase/ligase n=1 Tax=Gaiella sp. TaxID=2663207 RepID=UPI0032657052